MRQLEKWTPVSVVASFGGAMSAFLGASLISLAELLVFLASLAYKTLRLRLHPISARQDDSLEEIWNLCRSLCARRVS